MGAGVRLHWGHLCCGYIGKRQHRQAIELVERERERVEAERRRKAESTERSVRKLFENVLLTLYSVEHTALLPGAEGLNDQLTACAYHVTQCEKGITLVYASIGATPAGALMLQEIGGVLRHLAVYMGGTANDRTPEEVARRAGDDYERISGALENYIQSL